MTPGSNLSGKTMVSRSDVFANRPTEIKVTSSPRSAAIFAWRSISCVFPMPGKPRRIRQGTSCRVSSDTPACVSAKGASSRSGRNPLKKGALVLAGNQVRSHSNFSVLFIIGARCFEVGVRRCRGSPLSANRPKSYATRNPSDSVMCIVHNLNAHLIYLQAMRHGRGARDAMNAAPPPVHSGLMPAAFMIGNSRASSASRKALISAGEVGHGVAPRSA
jgi:hypothetical protein